MALQDAHRRKVAPVYYAIASSRIAATEHESSKWLESGALVSCAFYFQYRREDLNLHTREGTGF